MCVRIVRTHGRMRLFHVFIKLRRCEDCDCDDDDGGIKNMFNAGINIGKCGAVVVVVVWFLLL